MSLLTSALDLPDYSEDDEREFQEYLRDSWDGAEYGEDVEAELALSRQKLTREKACWSRSSISTQAWRRRNENSPSRRLDGRVRVVHRLGTRSRARRRTTRHAPGSASDDSDGDPPPPPTARSASHADPRCSKQQVPQSSFKQRNKNVGERLSRCSPTRVANEAGGAS